MSCFPDTRRDAGLGSNLLFADHPRETGAIMVRAINKYESHEDLILV
jgi:hypothetical protein